MTKSLTILYILFSLTSFCQSGKIIVRKTENTLIGKTLNLNDLRGIDAGVIYFKSDSVCKVTLEIDFKNSILKAEFENIIPNKQEVNCTYSIINDSLLLLKNNNYQDTCYYKYINNSLNTAQLKNTLHGIIEADFTICFHLDSILYSQSYNQNQSDFRFTNNIEIDSIYKNILNKKLKKELENKLVQEIENYKSNLSYNYFKGRYCINKNTLVLYSNNKQFTKLNLLRNQFLTTISSPYLIDGNKPLTSIYSHNNYGDIQFNYDKAIINFLIPQTSREKNDFYIQQTIKKDTFNIIYSSANEAILIKNNDSLYLWQNSNYNVVRIKNTVGGYYQTQLKSLNNNTLSFKKNTFYYSQCL